MCLSTTIRFVRTGTAKGNVIGKEKNISHSERVLSEDVYNGKGK